jgi:hypothetical protein
LDNSISEARSGFSWEENFSSFCDAPLKGIDLSEFDDKHPARLFDAYWQSLSGGTVPDRSRFSPTDTKYALRWLMLFKKDTTGIGTRFQLSLIGSSAVEMAIHASQGQYLEEFTSNDCYNTRKTLMETVLNEEKPGFARIEVTPHSEFRTTVTAGMFPFKGKSGEQVFVVPAPENKAIRALM